jgi:hypothetical protein
MIEENPREKENNERESPSLLKSFHTLLTSFDEFE